MGSPTDTASINRLNELNERLAQRTAEMDNLQTTKARLDAEIDLDLDQYAAQAGYEPVNVTKSNPFYLHRMFTGKRISDKDKVDDIYTGAAASMKARKLNNSDDLRDFLEGAGADMEIQPSARRSMEARNIQQGRMTQRATAAREVFGDDAMVSDPRVREAIGTMLNQAKSEDPALYESLARIFEGMPPRGSGLELLARANRVFKPAAVYGMFIPKVGSIVRNRVGGVWQAASEGTLTPESVLRLRQDFTGAISDAVAEIGGRGFAKDQFTQSINIVDEAFKQAKGDPRQVKAFLREMGRNDLVEALDYGVLDTLCSRRT